MSAPAKRRTPWIGRITIAVAVVLLGYLVLVGSCSGYEPRRYVMEAISESLPLRQAVEIHYRSRGALPASSRELQLRPESMKLRYAQRVEWNAADRMVVVTMEPERYRGKRFGWVAAGGPGGAVEWTCKTIDLEAKYLPADCR